ncbi:hypothetical protein [Dactylosporangium sp. NPDC051541]|uniref:hypothetical protein n=1 Tax=Dactylosporangium sp. NPDC051541 TaxID=3363977 RepID=UPI0037A2773F
MSGIEVAIVGIGGAVVKSAVKLWLGDRAIAGDAAMSAIDVLAGRTARTSSHRI